MAWIDAAISETKESLSIETLDGRFLAKKDEVHTSFQLLIKNCTQTLYVNEADDLSAQEISIRGVATFSGANLCIWSLNSRP
jgi:hypothetical protein